MNIIVATLCDFAQTREGLLFVASGGITRMRRPQFPAPFGVMLALMIEASASEVAEVVEARVAVEDADGRDVASIAAGIQMDRPEDLDRGELMQLPLSVDLRLVPIPNPGRFMVRVSLPGRGTPDACLSVVVRESAELPSS